MSSIYTNMFNFVLIWLFIHAYNFHIFVILTTGNWGAILFLIMKYLICFLVLNKWVLYNESNPVVSNDSHGQSSQQGRQTPGGEVFLVFNKLAVGKNIFWVVSPYMYPRLSLSPLYFSYLCVHGQEKLVWYMFDRFALMLQVYIQTAKGVLIEVSPQTRIPRTFKRFAGLMGGRRVLLYLYGGVDHFGKGAP